MDKIKHRRDYTGYGEVRVPVAEQIQYPRRLAAQVLSKVLSDKQALDEVLDSVGVGLNPSQMAWLQEVCSGTLRWKGRLDGIIDSLSVKKKPTGWVRKILLIAAYQVIVQQRVHAGLVVSESVALIRGKDGDAPAKFANACLRKMSEYAESWKIAPYPVQTDAAADWSGLPRWLWFRLVKQYGLEWSKQFAEACLNRPETWLRARRNDWVPSFDAQKGEILGSWKFTQGGKIHVLPGFEQGEFIVQDISGQTLVNEMFTQVSSSLGQSLNPESSLNKNINRPLSVLDLCAAPGGKSVALSWLGANVTATDRSESRCNRLRETLTRAAPSVSWVAWEQLVTETSTHDRAKKEDQSDPQDLKNKRFDFVYVDAPCTGTGIIRRHPDVRWLRAEKDIQSLTQIQMSLIHQALEKTRPGGFVGYSVCSVLKDEGEFLLEQLAQKNAPFKVIRTWLMSPQDSPNGDGFWGALLEKK